MRAIIIFLFGICLLGSCRPKEAPRNEEMVAATSVSLPPSHLTPQERQAQQDNIRRELDYYLERHNVMDEGFDMVARYAESGDSTLSAYMPRGTFLLRNQLRWSQWPREGNGVATDAKGRIVLGVFHCDTLVSGIRIDPSGTYAGQFNAQMQASGHGSYRDAYGNYYEGSWQEDRREGFGFCVGPDNLRAGQWRKDRFRGEQMLYTTERIYGIDISRYQHERGRRVYPILWKFLRITHLGRRISEQRVDGAVDYPVSFVYIKSTEGISIRNKYFAADYQNCHRHHIPVGSYHFFSTKQDASAQATHFLLSTNFQDGDLPPMLDIEPSDAHIAQMGGPEVLFREVRTWLNIVERATGVRPLLYVNQRFVNTWLDYASDLKQNYHFWIARYGEYKPDIHLDLWQLSADGRVQGIQGTVDLNVFNGYEGQWEEFLREETIKLRKSTDGANP